MLHPYVSTAAQRGQNKPKLKTEPFIFPVC